MKKLWVVVALALLTAGSGCKCWNNWNRGPACPATPACGDAYMTAPSVSPAPVYSVPAG